MQPRPRDQPGIRAGLRLVTAVGDDHVAGARCPGQVIAHAAGPVEQAGRRGLGGLGLHERESVCVIDDEVGLRRVAIAPLGTWARNARGSSVAKVRMSGASRFAEGSFGNSARQSVDLPLWRGPVRVTAGNCRAALRSRGVRSHGRGEYPARRLFQNQTLNQSGVPGAPQAPSE